MKNFYGTFSAVVTPFLKDGSIDFLNYEKYLNAQIRAGVQGVVVCGTTGESPTLESKEKLELFEKSLKVCSGKIKVIAGTGTNNTQETLELSKSACQLGVDALLIVTPYYNKPSQAGLEAHFKTVADKSSKPVILYNVPGRTQVSISAKTVGKLSQHTNILGIKEATGNMAVFTEMKKEAENAGRRDFLWLSGDDPTLHSFMALGGHGVISVASNVLPKSTARIVALSLESNFSESLKIFEKVFSVFNGLFIETNPVPCKTILAWLGFMEAHFRLPLVGMAEENILGLKKLWSGLSEEMRKEMTHG